MNNETISRLLIGRDEGLYCLVDSNGKIRTANFKFIEEKNGYLIATVGLHQLVLDPYTGKDLSKVFKRIDVKGPVLLGFTDFGDVYLLHPKTCQPSDQSYKEIYLDRGLLIGETTAGFKVLLDCRTTREISKRYKNISWDNGKVYGKDIFKELHEIKL